MNPSSSDRLGELLKDGALIDRALREAVRQALWEHRQLGQPIVVWQDGKVVWIPPEEIPVDDPPAPAA